MSIRLNARPQASPPVKNSRHNQITDGEKAPAKPRNGQALKRSADDAPALSVQPNQGDAQQALTQGLEKIHHGLSLVKATDDRLDQVTANLQRLRELAMTGANESLGPEQREGIQADFEALKGDLDRVAGTTEFDGRPLLDGSAGVVEIEVAAAGPEPSSPINLDLGVNLDATSLGLQESRVSGVDGAPARRALEDVDTARQQVDDQRDAVTAAGNRLMRASRSLAGAMENTAGEQSRPTAPEAARDTAMMARQQILTQGAVAVQLQSHGLAANALNLLK